MRRSNLSFSLSRAIYGQKIREEREGDVDRADKEDSEGRESRKGVSEWSLAQREGGTGDKSGI